MLCFRLDERYKSGGLRQLQKEERRTRLDGSASTMVVPAYIGGSYKKHFPTLDGFKQFGTRGRGMNKTQINKNGLKRALLNFDLWCKT